MPISTTKRAAVVAGTMAVGLTAAVLGSAGPALAAGSSPMGRICTPSSVQYTPSGVITYNGIHQTIPTITLVNTGKTTATLGETVSISATVGASLAGSLQMDESVLVASMKQTVTVTISASVSGTISTNASMQVRPGKTGYIQAGVVMAETNGTATQVLSNCILEKQNEVASAPEHLGFVTSGG